MFDKTKTMTKETKDIFRLFLAIIFVSFWIILVSSCGVRKAHKTNVKEDIKTEIATTDKKDVETKTETKTVVLDEINELEITPIDTSKILIINGKTYKNAKVKIFHRKTATNTTAKAIVKDNSVKTAKESSVLKSRTVEKQVERKSYPFAKFLWLLIPIAIYLFWKYKYKIIGL